MIYVCINFSEEFTPLLIGGEQINDMETAIKTIRSSNIKNVQLRQYVEDGINTWDNF